VPPWLTHVPVIAREERPKQSHFPPFLRALPCLRGSPMFPSLRGRNEAGSNGKALIAEGNNLISPPFSVPFRASVAYPCSRHCEGGTKREATAKPSLPKAIISFPPLSPCPYPPPWPTHVPQHSKKNRPSLSRQAAHPHSDQIHAINNQQSATLTPAVPD
jgi:hypothetical protein